MIKSGKYFIIPAFVLLTLGALLGVKLEAFISSKSDVKNLEKLEEAFLFINRQYVDEVDSRAIAEDAIEGMLQDLDPHSVYISAEEIEEVQEEYQGSFGGIGVWFEIPTNGTETTDDDTLHVVSTISDGPSEQVGVMAGDRIIAIDDSSAIGLSNREVQKRLKGPIGTKVDISVNRPGVRTPVAFTIIRGRIPLYTVDSAYMMDDQTGYMRVSRFAMTTYQEFTDHLSRLREQGMERLILDLRDNPGGVMDGAVQIVDEMLDSDKTIVYTKGRQKNLNAVHRSTSRGIFEQQPVIVLVSPSSASASEIVAGALQDHDRALIVGQRTFGKGLVQQQFRLTDGSVLQMTVSRYYTPAGRLIQTPYSSGDQAAYYEKKFENLRESIFHPGDYIESIPDSLTFKTDHGRLVFGGGGILPDYVVAPDTTKMTYAVTQRALDGLFAREWFNTHEQELRTRWANKTDEFKGSFEVSEQTWKEFMDYLETKDVKPSSDAANQTRDYSPAEIEESRPVLETRLKAHVARLLFGLETALPIYNSVDPTLQEANRLWSRADELAAYYRNTN